MEHIVILMKHQLNGGNQMAMPDWKDKLDDLKKLGEKANVGGLFQRMKNMMNLEPLDAGITPGSNKHSFSDQFNELKAICKVLIEAHQENLTVLNTALKQVTQLEQNLLKFIQENTPATEEVVVAKAENVTASAAVEPEVETLKPAEKTANTSEPNQT